jgi:hypothetical protein
MQFKTIRQTAKLIPMPEQALRNMVRQKLVPGFYSGTRFYVNVDMLRQKLNSEEPIQNKRTA